MNKTLFRKRRRLFASAAAVLAFAASPVMAQLGNKPVRIIVPLTAGSTVDAVARAMGSQLSKNLGQPVMIENLVGAGGVTGTAQLVRAPKDGSTIAMVSSNHVINPGIYKAMPFDSLKDITPLTIIGTVPLVLVAHPAQPYRNLKELIAAAKANPRKINYGSAGNGSVLHLAGELLKSEAGGIQITHIPYRGTGPLTNDLLGGQVEIGFISVTAAAPHIKAGKLRALGVSTKKRSSVLPDIPTLAEEGLPHYSFDAWIAMIAPAGVQEPVVQKLHHAAKAALDAREVQDALAAQGIAVIGSGPEAALSFFREEQEKHLKLVKQSGASID